MAWFARIEIQKCINIRCRRKKGAITPPEPHRGGRGVIPPEH